MFYWNRENNEMVMKKVFLFLPFIFTIYPAREKTVKKIMSLQETIVLPLSVAASISFFWQGDYKNGLLWGIASAANGYQYIQLKNYQSSLKNISNSAHTPTSESNSDFEFEGWEGWTARQIMPNYKRNNKTE